MLSTFAKTDSGRELAKVSSILDMKATVTNDLIIIFKSGSLVKVNTRANIVIIDEVLCKKLSRMFTMRVPLDL